MHRFLSLRLSTVATFFDQKSSDDVLFQTEKENRNDGYFAPILSKRELLA